MLALIDGDIVAYRAASVQQETINWGDGVKSTTVTGTAEEVRREAVRLTQEWIDMAGCSEARVALSCPSADGFRRQLLPSYKALRGEKPVFLPDAKAAIAEAWRTDTVAGLEADDLLGIMMTRIGPKGAAIVSIDKDMLTIPGRHFNPNKDKFPRIVSEREADARWMKQTLMGDPTDGYKGCPGIGEVKASKILGGVALVDELWPKVVAAFAGKKLSIDDAILQARMARILRNEDYDSKTKEVILWHPTMKCRQRMSLTPAPSASPTHTPTATSPEASAAPSADAPQVSA